MIQTLTGRERVQKILRREIPDRIGLSESFWPDTIPSWIEQGYPAGEPPWKVFNHDLIKAGGNDTTAFPKRSEIIEESDQWRTVRDGNGATLRRWKNRPGVPEHIGFEVINGDVWRARYRDAVLTFNPARVNLAPLEETLKVARENGLFCCFCSGEVFETGKGYAGHENMCMGMLSDPDWIDDMFTCFTTMLITNWQYIFDKVGLPDGAWIWSDLGFRGQPFIGLDMYRERVLPHHKRLFDFLHSKGLPVILHSCGFIEPLVPGYIEAGIDMLQAMEVKAGVDVRRLKPLYGDKIGFMGNVDIRALETNDLDKVRDEVKAKVTCAAANGGYIFHTDHSVPKSVRYETYRFAQQQALKFGQY